MDLNSSIFERFVHLDIIYESKDSFATQSSDLAPAHHPKWTVLSVNILSPLTNKLLF